MASGAAVVDTTFALIELARTTALFRIGGRRAVARATRAAMQRAPDGRPDLPIRADELYRMERAVTRAKRLWPGQVRCLQTALSLQAVLRRRNVAGVLRIGMKADGDSVEGHAWVEVAGFTLDDVRLAGGYTPFRPPAPPREQVIA